MDEKDSIQDHVNDTLIAGDGLCDRETVEFVVKNGEKTINWLVEQGVMFTKDKTSKNFHLGQEGVLVLEEYCTVQMRLEKPSLKH